MLVGFGSNIVEIKSGKSGSYYGRRVRPWMSGAVGPFESWNDALKAAKDIPMEPQEEEETA